MSCDGEPGWHYPAAENRTAYQSLALLLQHVVKEKGEEGVMQPPCTLHWNWASFQGKTGLLSPPRPGRDFSDEGANESGRCIIFVSNGNRGLCYTKQTGSDYKVNMACLSPWNQDICKHWFIHQGQDLIKPLVVAQCSKSGLLCNCFCTCKQRLLHVLNTLLE